MLRGISRQQARFLATATPATWRGYRRCNEGSPSGAAITRQNSVERGAGEKADKERWILRVNPRYADRRLLITGGATFICTLTLEIFSNVRFYPQNHKNISYFGDFWGKNRLR